MKLEAPGERWRYVRLLAVRDSGPGVRILRLEKPWPLENGQSIGLSVGQPPLPFRWYSVSSPASAPWVEVVFGLVPGGGLTPRLWELKPGDELAMHRPRGHFRDQEPPAGGRTWWIANGTGISPFAAMAADGFKGPRTLLHGIRESNQAHYSEVFTGTPHLEYIPCLSAGATEGADRLGPSAWPGRLTAWLQAHGGRLGAPDDRWMLCGSTGMVAEVRSILIGHGVSHECIHSETWY